MTAVLSLLVAVLSFLLHTVFVIGAGFPNGKIYGVNLGSWLVLEPWMLPGEWLAMGGEKCSDCSTCIASEYAFAQANPDTVDEKFDNHWSSWFTQNDVNKLVELGLNTVRIPLGYWIVEPLVDRSKEFYPRGGMRQLKRGLQQLKSAGVSAILDHHALPGVQTPGQMFTGRCTNNVEFYTPHNYHRALVWTAVMTALSHIDPDFGSVFAIEAVNEPIMDASQTPGYGDFQKNFVRVVRAVELSLGITVPGFPSASGSNQADSAIGDVTTAFTSSADRPEWTGEIAQVLVDAVPVLTQVLLQLNTSSILSGHTVSRSPLVTNLMDIIWQNNGPPNPADAKIGPQAYDDHLYYSFGGVADANPTAYMQSICNLDRVQADAAVGNNPVWFGEWALSTQFRATDDFLVQWADAQKRAYSEGAGWIFWNFKVEISDAAGDLARQWSYFHGVELGYLTRDPSQLHDPRVCDGFIDNTTSTSR